MAIYRGLNTQLYLADVDDKDTALESLGLNIDDFEVIRGLDAGGMTQVELRTISGLDLDQKKELYALSRTSATIGNLLRDMKDIQIPLDFNMRINSQLRAGAIKYDFIDWSNPTSTKSADISTSRISSWSSADSPATPDSDIFYGGEVEVIGNNVEASSLHMLEAPIAKRYPAEVPTDVITVNINGVAKQIHAMKGIPLTFEGFFKNANLRGKVSQIGNIQPVWTITNEDNGRFYETWNGTNSTMGSNSTYYFRDSLAHPRKIDFYYNPNNIEEFDLYSLNLTSLPNVSLPNLITYNLYFNDFYEVPNFASIAPSLRNINMTGNNLSRTGASINTQLSRFSNTITNLVFNGCFTDNVTTDLDLSGYTNLNTLYLNSHYSRYGVRQLAGATTTPHVNPGSIATYSMTYQPFTRLSQSVCDSTNTLSKVYINGCNIVAARDKNGVDRDIEFSSTSFKELHSYSNNHNVVKFNVPATINSVTHYYHTYSSPGGVIDDAAGRSVSGKFIGCGNLQVLHFYGTSIRGNVGADFKNLPSLDYLDVRWSQLGGSFNATSFEGTDSIRWLLLAGSWHNDSNFFGATLDGAGNVLERGQVFRNKDNLQYLYCYNNRNIRGSFPDVSRTKKLRVIYMPNNGLNGTIPNFGSNDLLYYINLQSNYFSGSVPSFNGNQFYYIYLGGNSLSGNLSIQQGANIRRFYVHYNQISGTVPSFEFTPRMEYLYMYNNQINGFSTGTLNNNIRLRRFDISNNRLSVGSVRNIIFDMLENYQKNGRGGVTINILGQTDTSGNPVTEADVTADEATAEALQFLRGVGWTILI